VIFIMMKRLLSAILASLMLVGSLAACAKGDDPANEGGSTQGDTAETQKENFPDVEKQNYGGETFQMIGWSKAGDWYFAEEYESSEKGGSILNNTIYEMNTMVEEYLNVELAYKTVGVVTGGEIYDTVYPTVMAGDDTYQLCTLHAYYDYTNFIGQNLALDFYELEDVDFDASYWNRDVMDMLAINDHAYIGLNDFCSYHFYMLYCNKDMMKRANLAVPYDDVRNGQWTLDKFVSLTTGLYVDNGDGQRNEYDTYGFASCWDGEGNAFLQAANIYVATRNDDGDFELTLYNDRFVEMYDRLFAWSQNESVLCWNFHSPAFTVPFKNNQSYFTCASLGTHFLDAEFEVGILPLPKYDLQQDDYKHVNWGNNLIIPNTIKNKEMVGHVVEMLAYYSETVLLPKYYDEVLQLRVSEAPDDRDMVELIYNTVVYDPAIAYCDGNTGLYNLVYITCFGIRENNPNVASYYKTNSKPAQRMLNNFIKKVQKFDQ
jgi:ABC-type glycerol-3-phosphate transport system substrate-binding protein